MDAVPKALEGLGIPQENREFSMKLISDTFHEDGVFERIASAVEIMYGLVEGQIEIGGFLESYAVPDGKDIKLAVTVTHTMDNLFSLAKMGNAAVKIIASQMEIPDQTSAPAGAKQLELEEVDGEAPSRMREPGEEPVEAEVDAAKREPRSWAGQKADGTSKKTKRAEVPA
jgi:hypothetical protein